MSSTYAVFSLEAVGFPAKLLSADERVVIQTRTHVKVLILPAIALVAICLAVGVAAAVMPEGASPFGQLALGLLGLVLVIWWVVLPFLRWWTGTYTVTDRRLIMRRGILTKVGKDIPLMRINDVSYQRSLLDRILGCGSLYIQTAAEGGTIKLDDVPDVERVHLEMTELLFGSARDHRHGRSLDVDREGGT
jgi:uncharacterized membrane protein YdbT with pleckstrin-like domain